MNFNWTFDTELSRSDALIIFCPPLPTPDNVGGQFFCAFYNQQKRLIINHIGRYLINFDD